MAEREPTQMKNFSELNYSNAAFLFIYFLSVTVTAL